MTREGRREWGGEGEVECDGSENVYMCQNGGKVIPLLKCGV